MKFFHRKGRVFVYGSNVFLSVLIFLAIIIIANYLSNKYRHRVDMTRGGFRSLSDETVSVLKGLDRDVRMIAFYRPEERKNIEPLLKQYDYHTNRVSYEFVDPDKAPAMARRYNIRQYKTIVLISGEREEQVGFEEERHITNGMVRVTRDRQKVVYFLTGHGENPLISRERDGMGVSRDRIQELNYLVKPDPLLLARVGSLPDDCSLLVISGPKKTLLPTEVDSIGSYLDKGGKLLLLLDPDHQSGLEGLLESYSVKLEEDFVVDNSGVGGLFGLDYSMPVATRYADHEITAKMKGVMTSFMLVRSVTASPKDSESNAETTEIVKTSNASWGERDLSPLRRPKDRKLKVVFDPKVDRKGPVPLAVAVSATPKTFEAAAQDPVRENTRLVVIGDSDFATNQFFNFQGNGDLLLNSVSWLLEEEDQIAIRRRESDFNPINLNKMQGSFISYLVIGIIPGLVFLAGFGVWWRRR